MVKRNESTASKGKLLRLQGLSIWIAAISATIYLLPTLPIAMAQIAAQEQGNVAFQIRANTVAWDQDRWGPKVIDLNDNDDTRLAGYNANLTGKVQLTSRNDIEPRKIPFGFLSPRDTIRWTVDAPHSAAYKVAVLYHPGNDDNVGSTIVISAGRSKAVCSVRKITMQVWVGGPQNRPSFRRDWLRGSLWLHAGRNIVVLRVFPTSREVELARRDLAHPVFGWPKRSLHIASIELARPEAIARIQVEAQHLKSSTEWMVHGKYGLFIQWAPESFPLFGNTPAWQRYEKAVDEFNVEAFADMVAKTGAAWVVFTTTHGKYYFPGPLHALDEVLPGRTCHRDLIGEIADALAKRNVRLLLYFHPGPGPTTDPEWAKAAGISPVNDRRNIGIMLSIYREIGTRYGNRLAGWFIDGGDGYYRRNYPFAQLESTLKEGNPARVVTFFQWLWPKFSPCAGDFLSNVTFFAAPLPPPLPRQWLSKGGPYEGLQPQYNFTLEDEWSANKPMNGRWPAPIYPKEELVNYFRKMAAAKWPLTINIVITQDVTDKHPFVNPVSLDELVAVRIAIRGR